MRNLKKIGIAVVFSLFLLGCQKTEEQIVPQQTIENVASGRTESTQYTHWYKLGIPFGVYDNNTRIRALDLATCRNYAKTAVLFEGGKVLAHIQVMTFSGSVLRTQKITPTIDLATGRRLDFTKNSIPRNALRIELVLTAYKLPTATICSAASSN